MTSTTTYTKKEASFISGIAILLMVVHHMGSFEEWRLNTSELITFFEYKGICYEYLLSIFGRICVALFAFNTGYSMFVNRRSYDLFRKRLKRILKFLICYWVVYVVYIIYAIVAKDSFPDIPTVILNLFGFRCSVNPQYVCVPFAWYVSFYVSVILFFPIIEFLFRKNRYYWLDIIYSVLILLALVIFRDLVKSHPLIYNYFNNLLYVGCIFVGYFVAKYKLLMKTKNIGKIWCVLILFCLPFVRWLLLQIYYAEWLYDMFLGVILIYCILHLIEKRVDYIIKFILFLGGISMNIWFLHGLFYTGNKRLQYLLYLPKYFVLEIVWAFILLIPIALLLKYIQEKVIKKLNL